MSPSPSDAQRGELRVTRLELRTLAAVDLGWALPPEAAGDAFLRDRGRPGWLDAMTREFSRPADGFSQPKIEPSAYSRSAEYGRPTFSDEFSTSYMPLVFRRLSPVRYISGTLIWSLEWLKLGHTGAMSICMRAELNRPVASALDIIQSYHSFRRDIQDHWPDLVSEFLSHWSSTLPRYALVDGAADVLIGHTETYDVVDFDFTVDGVVRNPKELYREGAVASLRALAGLTRMSHVMEQYGEENVRALQEMDLGSRPDELWIVNVERLTRHHREHLTDLGKRLYLEDIISATEIILQQRATLKYVTDLVRRMRATFLDRLTDEPDIATPHEVMQALLKRIAWASDLYSETPAVHRDSGSSFFRTIVSNISELKEIDSFRDAVSGSVRHMLEIATAIFEERSAAASVQLQEASIGVERSSRNTGIAAVALAVAAAVLTIVQVVIAIDHPQGSPETPGTVPHTLVTGGGRVPSSATPSQENTPIPGQKTPGRP